MVCFEKGAFCVKFREFVRPGLLKFHEFVTKRGKRCVRAQFGHSWAFWLILRLRSQITGFNFRVTVFSFRLRAYSFRIRGFSFRIRVLVSEPGVFSFRIFLVSESWVLVSESVVLVSESCVLVSEPGVVVSESGVLVSEPGRHPFLSLLVHRCMLRQRRCRNTSRARCRPQTKRSKMVSVKVIRGLPCVSCQACSVLDL